MSKTKPIMCYLLRHADAGRRGVVNDTERGLSKKGRAQAERIARRHDDGPVRHIVSSPYARCVQTVEPLSNATGIAIEIDDALGEGVGPSHAISLIESALEPMILCSHGDVIGEVMTLLDRRGVPLDDDRLAKASAWELTVTDGAILSARYLPPPR